MSRPVYAVFVAGGSGTRMGSSTPKQFLYLGGIPILQRSVERFLAAEPDAKVVIVLPERELERWKELGTYLIMKFNDQVVKKEKDGKWELTEDGICVSTERPGYPEQYRQTIAKETGDRYMVPNQK